MANHEVRHVSSRCVGGGCFCVVPPWRKNGQIEIVGLVHEVANHGAPGAIIGQWGWVLGLVNCPRRKMYPDRRECRLFGSMADKGIGRYDVQGLCPSV